MAFHRPAISIAGRGLWLSRRHPRHRVSEILSGQQCSGPIDGGASRPPVRLILRVDEAGDDVLGLAARLSAAEGHDHHLVTVEGAAIPAAVLAHEGATAAVLGKAGAGVHGGTRWG